MKIIYQGHDPYQKGVYLCDCDCKGHAPSLTIVKVTAKKQEKSEKAA